MIREMTEMDSEITWRLARAKELKPKELGDKSLEDLVIWSVMFATENIGDFAAYVSE